MFSWWRATPKCSERNDQASLMHLFFVLFCRQLERQGQEEEHHWDRPSETPEGCLPQIQVRCSAEINSTTLKRSRITSSELNVLCRP